MGAQAEAIAVHGEGITEARFGLDTFAGTWCRLVDTDAAGKRAWAQPITVPAEPEQARVQ